MDTNKTTSGLPADASGIPRDERPPSTVDVNFENYIDYAPLHLNAVRTPVRLQGKLSSSQNSLTKVAASRSRSSSRSRPTSRDTSPCPSDISGMITLSRVSSTASSIAGDLDSSITSGGVQINIDPDILLDRIGMETSFTINDSNSLSGSVKILPCLNERMSDETLDDCHAFTDLRNVIRQIPGASAGPGGSDPARSRDGSVCGGSILGDASCLLETLKEFEEESDGGDDINVSLSCEDDEISALGLSIKHRMSLDATSVNELGVTCSQIEVDHSEEFDKKD